MRKTTTFLLLSALLGGVLPASFAKNATTNVALNKPATASASTALEIPGRAFDGDTTTNWCAPGYLGWIAVDLQSAFTVDSLRLHVNQYSPGNTVHEIKVSDDMVNWKLVKTLSESTYQHQTITIPFPTALSDVRGVMINTTSTNSWVAWYEIEVHASLSKPKITQDGYVLTSNSTVNNQWYLNGNPISGATSQSYTVTTAGSYQVGVTVNNGPESLSDAVTLTNVVGLSLVATRHITIYPNPVSDRMTVEGATNGKVELFNLQGQRLRSLNLSTTQTSMDLSGLPRGIYSVTVSTHDGRLVQKIVKD